MRYDESRCLSSNVDVRREKSMFTAVILMVLPRIIIVVVVVVVVIIVRKLMDEVFTQTDALFPARKKDPRVNGVSKYVL